MASGIAKDGGDMAEWQKTTSSHVNCLPFLQVIPTAKATGSDRLEKSRQLIHPLANETSKISI